MNIVLIGSCLDSSNLAKELNKKMKNSVVFRIDLLKNLKNIIPFSSLTHETCGDYLGDIEKIEFNKISETELKIAKAFQSSVKLIEESNVLSNAMSAKKATLPSIDRVTRNFDCLSLTLIRVVSGIQSVRQLTNYLGNNSSAVVVYLDKQNLPIFDLNITKEEFLVIKDSKVYENHLFLTAEDLTALLQDEVFNLLVNPVVKTKGEILKPIADEAKECVELAVTEQAFNHGHGLLEHLTNGPTNQTLTVETLDVFITDLGAQRMLNSVRQTVFANAA
jgi:hypothetical protein